MFTLGIKIGAAWLGKEASTVRGHKRLCGRLNMIYATVRHRITASMGCLS
jgi:hypothetical protein